MSNLFHDDHYTVSELTKKLASKLTDAGLRLTTAESGNDSNLLIVFYVQIMPDDLVMQLHR
ncbi:competence protein ComA, partial [Enterobacter kobei]